MAANTDYFTEVGNPGTATTLAAPGHTAGGTAITVGSTSNWPVNTGVIFAIDTVTLVNGVEVRDVGSYTEWEGVVSSSTSVTSLVIRYGTDQNYPAGSTTRVYIPVASSRENRLAQGMLVSHDQDGTLKSGSVDNAAVLGSNVVTTAKILDANVTTGKIEDGAITAPKVATNAISLGVAKVTSATASVGVGQIAVTGLSLTVTIPSGGRNIRISTFGQGIRGNTSGNLYGVCIWDGAVNSGTQIAQGTNTAGGVNYTVPASASAILTGVAAGSKTFNVSLFTGAGTASYDASATTPGYILVEAI